MTESQESGNNHSNCLDLLDILREKRKVRLGDPQPGEYIILEYSVEKANLQPESSIEIPTSSYLKDDKAFEANTNPAPESSKETFSDSTADLASEANANPLPESSALISVSSDLTDDTAANSKSNDTNEERADASSNKKSKLFSKVFISYSYDSDEHKKRVRELSERLNKTDGIKCVLDRDVVELKERWPIWMRKQIEEADFVIVVCTRKYKERANEIRGSGVYRSGVSIEAEIMETILYYSGNYNKFISVIFSENNERYIPTFLLGMNLFMLDVTNEKKYEMKFQELCNKVKYQVPKSIQELEERGVTLPE